jgi:hypothetical protein
MFEAVQNCSKVLTELIPIEIRFITDQPKPLPVDRPQLIVESIIFNTSDFMLQIHDVQLDLVCGGV